MQRTCHRLVMMIAMVGFVLTGCGDDQTAGDAAEGLDAPDDEDCPEGEFVNPATGECTEDPNAGESECGVGETFDEDEGECVPQECPDGEVWDDADEECVSLDEPGDCSEFEEWDEANETCVPTGECGPGSISGQTCRPDGGLLPGADVVVEGTDCDGYPFTETTMADNQGFYTLEDIPAGQHELTITSGSFEVTNEVTVNKGHETDLKSEAAKICLEGTEVDIAVLGGTWDDIGELLDGMGIDYDFIGSTGSDIGDFLGDLDEMREYDIIFAECGASWGGFGFDTDMETVENNVRRFVEEGNSLYASDLADDFIDDPLPEAVNFASSSGSGSQTVDADVLSTEMQDLLGSTTTEIYFNMGGFSIAESGGPASQVHFESDVSTGTSTVEDAALMTTYDDPIGNGRAIYTSFHNTAQATGDMEDILEFMIFTL